MLRLLQRLQTSSRGALRWLRTSKPPDKTNGHGCLPAQTHLNTYTSPQCRDVKTDRGLYYHQRSFLWGGIPPPAPSFAFWPPAHGGLHLDSDGLVSNARMEHDDLPNLASCRAPVCQVLSAGRAVGHMPDSTPSISAQRLAHLLSAKGPAAGTP
ncbi:hypothetical protein LX32DRAFT_343827 [Colletotrichum zoysiae]|uniref:Uncharacterized protein n=1 Tax=Colletotrichum zoysiae TaxID=1216348 RepID=A0AAD9HJB4_9PEZI|nr:hypothetical protein LX32DRAFT_343827 [Colletotrichum zoysiae]